VEFTASSTSWKAPENPVTKHWPVNNGAVESRKRLGPPPSAEVYSVEQKRQKLYSDFTAEAVPLPPSKIDLLVEQSVSKISTLLLLFSHH